MIKIIKQAVIKNTWLFLAAAWVFTLSFIFTNYFSYSSSSQKVARILSEYIHGQENSFKNILHDSATVNAIINDEPSPIKEQLISDAQGIFAYEETDVNNPLEIFWNTSKMSPAREDIVKPDGSYIVTYENGVFELVKQSFKKQQTNYFLIMLIPVRWQYFMRNEYLQPHFAVSETIDKEYEIAPEGSGVAITNTEGKTLFSIREINQSYSDFPAGFSIFLRILAMVLLFAFISNIATGIAKENKFIAGFLFLLVFFLLLRSLIFLFPFPFNYRATRLFDPSLYKGSFLNISLGDLLLNVLTGLWILSFIRKKVKKSTLDALRHYTLMYKILTYASFFIIPFAAFYVTEIISGLVLHSNISFNAADFFSLDIFSLVGFIIICVLLYIWLYISGLFVYLASRVNIPLFWRYILLITCSFLLISSHIFSVDAKQLMFVTLFILLIVTFIRYRDNPSFSSLVTSPYFIIWALILTAAASALIVSQNSITEKNTRIATAQNLQQETDSSGAFLVKLAMNNFSDNFLQNNFGRFNNADTAKFLRDSLISKNLPAYLKKYTTKIYLFDNNNEALYNDDSTSYVIINSVLANRSKPTYEKDLYYYRNSQNNYNYIYAKKIQSDSVYLGSLFVLIQPKLMQNILLVPELFKQTNNISALTETGYVIGEYDNRKLTSAFSGFNFSDSVAAEQVPKAGYYFKDSLGYNQLWFNAGNNKLLIIAKKNNAFFNFITLFSYLFVLFIVLSFAVRNSRRALEKRSVRVDVGRLFRFNIRTQIQATIIGVSIISFLIIGVATISFFILRFNKNTGNQLINTSQIIANEIENGLQSVIVNGSDSDVFNAGNLEKKISAIAVTHNTDINFYAKNGTLLVSSQPYIYAQQILSNRINPQAFYELHYNQSTRFVQTEQIGNFSFESIYTPVKNEKDETIAYLNIPSLSTANELKEEISDFLVTLIILNALIFIFAGAISVALTGRITSSLELIGNKMKQIKIGTANEEIEWKRNDEIGLLIDEYNKMVKQLGQSAETLATSEREGAWREMAKQVAHEIKNPLTPMKLSIQYLQRAMQENTPDAVEVSKKLASTLIEQIDQLSKIAGDFSQFANIENTKPEYFNINELIKSLVNLYNTNAQLIITFASENYVTEVFADKAQINRLFTNLFKNAIEAYDDTQSPCVHISEYIQNGEVIITVTDYGHGIPAELRSKIFNPNFTTKTSGTGLGLAICKAIAENAAGKIWFTTTTGAGSSFYVKLPLADNGA